MDKQELEAIKAESESAALHERLTGLYRGPSWEMVDKLVAALEVAQANENTWREGCEHWIAKEDDLRKAIKDRIAGCESSILFKRSALLREKVAVLRWVLSEINAPTPADQTKGSQG